MSVSVGTSWRRKSENKEEWEEGSGYEEVVVKDNRRSRAAITLKAGGQTPAAAAPCYPLCHSTDE